LEQTIHIYLEETEQLLLYAPSNLKRYIAPFLYQLHKLKKAPFELLNGAEQVSVINLIDLYVTILKEVEINEEELFVQLLRFTLKSVLILKRPEKLTYVNQTVLARYKFNNN